MPQFLLPYIRKDPSYVAIRFTFDMWFNRMIWFHCYFIICFRGAVLMDCYALDLN